METSEKMETDEPVAVSAQETNEEDLLKDDDSTSTGESATLSVGNNVLQDENMDISPRKTPKKLTSSKSSGQVVGNKTPNTKGKRRLNLLTDNANGKSNSLNLKTSMYLEIHFNLDKPTELPVSDPAIYKRRGVLFYDFRRRLGRREFHIKKIENLPKIRGRAPDAAPLNPPLQ